MNFDISTTCRSENIKLINSFTPSARKHFRRKSLNSGVDSVSLQIMQISTHSFGVDSDLHISADLCMALQSFIGPWAVFSVSWSFYTVTGLLGRLISQSQGRYLHSEQHKHRINANRHPCLEWDSNPRSQRSSERRKFMPSTAWPQWPAI
jgi:hypothetical protein